MRDYIFEILKFLSFPYGTSHSSVHTMIYFVRMYHIFAMFICVYMPRIHSFFHTYAHYGPTICTFYPYDINELSIVVCSGKSGDTERSQHFRVYLFIVYYLKINILPNSYIIKYSIQNLQLILLVVMLIGHCIVGRFRKKHKFQVGRLSIIIEILDFCLTDT